MRKWGSKYSNIYNSRKVKKNPAIYISIYRGIYVFITVYTANLNLSNKFE